MGPEYGPKGLKLVLLFIVALNFISECMNDLHMTQMSTVKIVILGAKAIMVTRCGFDVVIGSVLILVHNSLRTLLCGELGLHVDLS